MSKALRVSIVIPAYNEERYLVACLDAIAAQTVQPYEVIVVDNGSMDGTAGVARRYGFVRVISEPTRGRVYARGAGFDAAQAGIIARIDADAIVPPTWIATLTQYYADPTHATTAWSGGGLFYNVRFPRFISAIYNFLVFRFNHVLTNGAAIWGSNMALPVALWRAVRPEIEYRNDIHEDLDLAIHLRRHGYDMFYDKHTLVHAQLRRIHSNRHELWEYLQMWPRTLRIHGIWTWPICWFFGDLLLFLASPLPLFVDYLARLFGRSPLND